MDYTIAAHDTPAADAARETLVEERWMEFSAWEDGKVDFYLNEDGEVVAYVRWDDKAEDGLAFFEVRSTGCGLGTEIIEALKEQRPNLFISGELNSKACARFWHRMGLVGDEVELYDGRIVRF